jgi:hypothetical protein
VCAWSCASSGADWEATEFESLFDVSGFVAQPPSHATINHATVILDIISDLPFFHAHT